MEYNDFAILNDDLYENINKKYLEAENFNRKSIVQSVCNLIYECLNECLFIEQDYNNKISFSINQLKLLFAKLLDNFSASFNLQIKGTNVTHNNIFSFINKTLNVCKEINKWIKHETKEYYKSIAFNSLNELYNEIQNLILSFEKSEIKFYKYMWKILKNSQKTIKF